ncbi:uncharacterized protein LOC143278009 [Babylonia areolata]|uniref:uncharacterized protein LOC143278009 n=1 Tax=Babylonia areolata TaxID=304850 RepID=UPI003FD2CF9E
MTIIIMQRMASEASTINIYFTATAIMDTMYLLSLGLPEWMYCQFGYGLISKHDLLFKVHAWLYTGCSTIGCWCLVCMTVHRAVSVVWPHRVSSLCTRRTVLLALTTIGATIAILYAHHILFFFDKIPVYNRSVHYCGKASEDYVYFFENFFIYVDMLVYCALPFVFLAVSNSVLVWKLNASVRRAGKQLTQGNSEKAQARERAANSVTLTVIVVSIAFLVLTLPLTANAILNESAMNDLRELGVKSLALKEVPLSGNVVANGSSGDGSSEVSGSDLARVNFAHSVCSLLSLTNSSVNFYLYCLTGRRFRKEFIKVICRGRNMGRRDASSMTGDA